MLFPRRLLLAASLLVPALCAAETPNPPPPGPQPEAIKALIQKLNAAETVQREDAQRELLNIGQAALPELKEAANSPEPEIAARAKALISRLTEATIRPLHSYAEVFPANSIFFLEFPNAKASLDKLKDMPLGKFWDTQAMQTFYKGHYDNQLPDDQKFLDTIRAIPKLLDGRVVAAVGSPDTAEQAELDPPLVYVVESKQMPALEQQVRTFAETMGEQLKDQRAHGEFNVEEAATTQVVFGQQTILYSRTEKSMDSLLDGLAARPQAPLEPLLKDIRAATPQADAYMHINRDGFKNLVDAAVIIDEDGLAALDALGLAPGTTYQEAAIFNPNGFEEHARLIVGGDEKNTGIFSVFKQLATAVPPAPPAGEARALDLIPWQAGLLLSFQGDAAGNAPALAQGLRALDLLTGQVPVEVKPPEPAAAAPGAPDVPLPTAVPPKPADAAAAKNTAGGEAVAGVAGQAELKKDAAPAAPGAPAAAPAAPAALAAPEGVGRHVARFERIGMKLEQLLAQTQGPIQLAVFPHQVQVGETPDEVPVSMLVTAVLKDPQAVMQALELASNGDAALYKKETLNGGTHYIESDAAQGARPGFWLKDKYLAYSPDRELLDLAGAALAHHDGNERMADRASYKQAVADKRIGPDALLTLFGDADQVMEMPYKVGQGSWQEDEQNPWPDYDIARAILSGKPIAIQVKALPGGLQMDAQTPLGVIGMIEAFRRPLKQAGPF